MILRKAVLSSLAFVLAFIIFPSSAQADSVRNSEWILKSLNTKKARSYADGKGVVVAIIDSGIDASHPDLVNNILPGIDFSDPNRPDGFGDGWTDLYGHGTAMAGLVVGHGHGFGDTEGMLGIAPGAKILPVRDGISETTPEQVANSIIWAVNHGADVLCIAQASSVASSGEDQAIIYAESRNAVIIAGVGNAPAAKSVGYPAGFPGVIAAAGTDQHEYHASISVMGSMVVLSAPATNIYSTDLNHGYSVGDGTSNSTAIIAGAAALVRSRFPKLSAVEVIHRLTATATDLGPPGRDDEYGYGELNLVAALTANVPPLTTTVTPRPIHTATLPSTAGSTPAPTPATTTAAEGSGTGSGPWLPLTIGIVVVVAIVILLLVARRARASRSP